MTNILHAGFTGCAALLLATLLTAPPKRGSNAAATFRSPNMD